MRHPRRARTVRLIPLPGLTHAEPVSLRVSRPGPKLEPNLDDTLDLFGTPTAPPPPRTFSRINPDVIPPRKIHHVEPEYPLLAQRAGAEGTTLLRIIVDPGGNVSDIEILERIGKFKLDEEAVQAVRQWKYRPATFNGKAVPYLMKVAVAFESLN